MAVAKAKVIAHPAAPREPQGWRRGRPVEDPSKTKMWGWVTAKPSEFLVHCRRGRVLQRSSGQGASCFKWPWDSVAIVPTSLQRVQFTADQVTLEKVGVKVSGLAVYRIVNPLLAYRVLNFSFTERAQEKLDTVLVEMLIGASRRLIANLDVETCLTQRKSALAERLLEEISPVVGGRGQVDDRTDQGWGVVLDTIEIQEVTVLSESVFAAMQTPYRAQLELDARRAKAQSAEAAALREAEADRRMQEATIDSSAAVAARKAEVARQEMEARTQDTVRRQALLVQESQAEIEAHEVRLEAESRRSALEAKAQEAALERRRRESEVDLLEGRAKAEAAMEMARAKQLEAAAEAKVLHAENLPALAAAVGQRFGEVKVTHIGGGDSPFGTIAQAVASVLELVKTDE